LAQGALFLLLFSAEKAAQGARVLESVAALNAEIEFVEWQSYIDGSEPTAAAPRCRHGAGYSPSA
jgi:hypothetical protein